MLKLKQTKVIGYPFWLSCLTSWGIPAAFGLASGIWLIIGAIAPQIAQAEADRFTLSLTPQPGESYSALIERAEEVARSAAQQSFNSDAQISEILITVMGETRGQIVPLLTLSTNRELWNGRPVPRGAMTYYQTARGLLQFDTGASGSTRQPTPTTTPTTSSTSSATAGASTPGQPTSTTPMPAATPQPASSNSEIPDRTPVNIDIPAAPAGQLGLPRSILR
jgi:hypothetical protein